MTDKKYYEVKIKCSTSVAEALCAFLVTAGALGAVEENIFINNGEKTATDPGITAYFASKTDFAGIKAGLDDYAAQLMKHFPDFDEYAVIEKWRENENWREGYKKYFSVIKVSPRIVVKPDYEEYAPTEGEHVIIINPQMAFGIGNHPTTKMCVDYIDEILSGRRDTAKAVNMLDAGTGSGILAIASAKLGIKEIYGFDIDDIAVETAEENIAKNGVANAITLGCHGIDEVTGQYDIVLANILANILIDISEQLTKAVKPGGELILSGILDEQKGDVIAAFTGVKLVSSKSEGEWVALRFAVV